MPAEGFGGVVVDGEVEEAEAAGLGTNQRVSDAHFFARCDDVLHSKLLHILLYLSQLKSANAHTYKANAIKNEIVYFQKQKIQ